MSRHPALRLRSVVLTAALAGTAMLTGCATQVSVVPEPVNCQVPPEVLAQRCAEPAPLADGASFEQLIRAATSDRGNLRQCAAHDALLANVLRACNEAIDSYRVRIRAINSPPAGKP